jgi:hypothetical protein
MLLKKSKIFKITGLVEDDCISGVYAKIIAKQVIYAKLQA